MHRLLNRLPATLFAAVLVWARCPDATAAEAAIPGPTTLPAGPQQDQRMAWFRLARYGLFIHWGPCAIPAGEWKGKPVRPSSEWIMAHVPIAVNIASSRLTQRRDPMTQIEVFSNCDKVDLTVNGKALPSVSPEEVRVFRSPNVTLPPGKNQAKATGATRQGKVTDSCEWRVNPSPPQLLPARRPSRRNPNRP